MDGIINTDVYTENSEEKLRLNDGIKEEENKIKDLYCRIGKLYASMHMDDAEYEGDFAALLESLKQSKENKLMFAERILELKGMSRCPECKAENPLMAAFCTVCGKKIKSENNSDSEAVSESAKEPIELLLGRNKMPGFDIDNFKDDEIFNPLVTEEKKDDGISVEPVEDSRAKAAENEADKVASDEKIIEEPVVSEAEKPVEAHEEEQTTEAAKAEPEPEPEEEIPESDLELKELTSEEQTGAKCRKCGAVLEDGCVFCTECGERVEAEATSAESEQEEKSVLRCRKCGAVLEDGGVFCTECGERIGAEVIPTDCEAVTEDEESVTENETEEVEPVTEELKNEEKSKQKCRKCGAVLEDGCAFCIECGERVEAEATTGEAAQEEKAEPKCCKCGAVIEKDSAFCIECGVNLRDYDAEKESLPLDDGKKRCSECGTVIEKGDKECRGCGKPIFGDLMMPVFGKCRRCGAKNKSKLPFCTKCGAKF